MKIKIWVLNLGDADCTFILLIKEGKKFFITIDCGKPEHAEKVIPEIRNVFASEGINYIDVLILSHFDNDHVGGMIEVCKVFSEQIKEIWIHGISETITIDKSKRNPHLSETILPAESDGVIGSAIKNFSEDKSAIVIRTIEQEAELISTANHLKIPIKKPFSGNIYIEDFPEIEILGPSKDYLARMFPKLKDVDGYFEIETIREEIKEEVKTDPFTHLDSIQKSNISAINLVSVILLITIDEKKFLFTADAGIKSFYEIPVFEEKLNDIFWLKVPHHGSKNNINSDLIKLFSPKYAVVSGKKYYSKAVAACFECNRM